MSSPKRKDSKITEKVGLANLGGCPENAVQIVNQSLLHCPNCGTDEAVGTKFDALGVLELRYLVIECCSCAVEWCLCMECGPKQRSRIHTKQQIRDHTSNNHSESRKRRRRNAAAMAEPTTEQTTESVTDEVRDQAVHDDDDNDLQMAAEDDESSAADPNEGIDFTEVVNSNNLGFEDNKQSQAYFEQCYLGELTSGVKYLVMRSSRRSELEATEYSSEQLPAGHADLQARIANLAFLISRAQTESLVMVLQGSYKMGCENGFACSQDRMFLEDNVAPEVKKALQRDFSHDLVDGSAHAWSTKIPTNWNDVRQMYLEGSRSILSNLPIPQVRMDAKSSHSYVSVTECIRHFLAHRDLSDIAIIPRNLEETPVVDHPSISARAREIVMSQDKNNKHLTSYIFFWSDDVEPNRTKANRGSAWLLTATIGTHRLNAHSFEHTFPIAVGRKGQDHDPVVAQVEKEMQRLRSGDCPPFYIGGKKKKVKMVFETFCSLQDQPERRDFNCIRGGNAVNTSRFGVSADHGSLYSSNVLPACRACLEAMEQALSDGNCVWPMNACAECVRWDVLDDRNGLASWVAPDHYPATDRVIEKIEMEHGKECRRKYLRPFRITYASLCAAVDTAHNGYVNEGWSSKNCEVYLGVEGLSEKYINVVMDHCARSYSLKIARENPQKYKSILEAAAANPARYARAPLPAPWIRRTIDLGLHPDVVMHLIFLGVVKTSVLKVQDCLSAQMKLASFLKSTDKYLKEFLTMTVEWMPIQPYLGAKLGGWVSENFLAFSRILPWYYQNIDSAISNTTDFAPPDDLPQQKWLARHYKYWLQIRGLSTKGKKDELVQRCEAAMAEGAPEPLPAPEIPTASVEAVLLALMEVLTCVMSTKVTPELVNRTRYAVRVFLSNYDSLCRPLRQKTPAVISSYNFVCLLNVPDIMERFGPMRGLWEGDPKGEGFARFAKPLMTQGLKQNWHQMLMKRMHQAIAFRSVVPPEQQEQAARCSLKNKDSLRKRKGNFHLYKSAFDVHKRFGAQRSLDERVPISVVILEEGTEVKILVAVRTYDYVLQIHLDELPPIQHFGFHYYSFNVPDTDDGYKWTESARNASRIEYGFLLPLLKADDTENRFALVLSNWRRLSPSAALIDLL